MRSSKLEDERLKKIHQYNYLDEDTTFDILPRNKFYSLNTANNSWFIFIWLPALFVTWKHGDHTPQQKKLSHGIVNLVPQKSLFFIEHLVF